MAWTKEQQLTLVDILWREAGRRARSRKTDQASEMAALFFELGLRCVVQ